MKPLDKFFAMRLKSASRWPYAAEAILALIPVETEQVARMAIDRHWRVYFNPNWIVETADEFVITVVLHEFGHAIRRHFKRFIKLVGYDPEQLSPHEITLQHSAQSKTWNHAADCEINDDLLEEGLPIADIPGGGAVLPSTYNLPNGLTAEQYFEKLWETMEEQLEQLEQQADRGDSSSDSGDSGDNSEGGCESPGEGDQDSEGSTGPDGDEGQASADGQCSSDSDGHGDSQDGEQGSSDSESGNGQGSNGGEGQGSATSGDSGTGPASAGSDQPGQGTGNTGVDWSGSSSVDGFKRPWEYGKGDGEGEDINPDDLPAGLSEAEQEHLANQVAKKIEQAASSGRGTVPAGLRRWAHARLHPQVPWQRVLRNTVSRSVERMSGCKDYTFSRVSRREPTRPDLIASSPFAQKIKIRCWGDTSGSMGDKDLAVISAELHGVLKPYRDSVEYGSVDASCHECKRVRSRQEVEAALVGGGGTDMRLPIESVRTEKAATRPDVLIIITDGETPWPDTPLKGTDVIAVLTRKSTYRTETPSWIKSIEVN